MQVVHNFDAKLCCYPPRRQILYHEVCFWDQLDEQNLEIEVHFRTGMTAEAVRRQILTQFQGFGHLDKCEASRDRFSNGIYTSSTRECFVAISILFSLQLFFDYHKLQKLGSVVGNLKCIDKLTCVIKM